MQKGSVNKVILVGHLGGDPESRFTQGGQPLQRLALRLMSLEKTVREIGKIIQNGIDVCCLVSKQKLQQNM